MRIETTGLLYPAPLGAPLTPQTPAALHGWPGGHGWRYPPAVDALPLRGRREYAQLCLLRDDFAACLAVVNGMELGVFIRRARLFAFYGQRAPRLEVRPLRLDGSVRLAEAIPSVLPHQNTALLLSAVTFPDTPPGIYRTNLEVEGEAGVTYLPVAVEVAGVTAPPVETRTGPALTDPLDILFSAAGDGPFLLPGGGGIRGRAVPGRPGRPPAVRRRPRRRSSADGYAPRLPAGGAHPLRGRRRSSAENPPHAGSPPGRPLCRRQPGTALRAGRQAGVNHRQHNRNSQPVSRRARRGRASFRSNDAARGRRNGG